MKVLAQLAFFLLFLAKAQGQDGSHLSKPHEIKGQLFDSLTHSTVPSATVKLLSMKGATLAVTTSDSSGLFQFKNLKEASFSIRVESVGFIPKIAKLELDPAVTGEQLITILLHAGSKTLESVTVTAPPRLIENKIDKLVFNAEKDISSQTGVATDILKKIPQVSVDINGNVELAGASGIRFLINGKPSTAFGSNITDVLQAIPANQIKSVEVITNPGARYEAQGLGGIINIILKKSSVRGVNGNLSLAAGTRADNGSFNFNARRGKLGLNAYVSGNIRPAVNSYFDNRRNSFDSVNKSFLQQVGTNNAIRKGFNGGLGFDYSINSKNNISGSLSYNQFGYTGRNVSNQFQAVHAIDTDSLLTDFAAEIRTLTHFQFDGIDASLNYKRTFKKEDQELDIAVTTSHGHVLTDADNYQLLLPSKERYYGNNSHNPGTQSESELKIDYTQPLTGKLKFGAGGRFSNASNISRAAVLSYDANTGDYGRNDFLSNSLDYHMTVYAAYSELSVAVTKWLDAKLGGRFERTDINATYSNAGADPVKPGYNTFVPSLFLMHKISDNQQLKLNYSKRIQRPDYNDLNPFINTNDPKNLSTGNPFLLPEIARRVELSYNQQFQGKGSVMAGIFYRVSTQDIQSFVRYYPSFEVGDTLYHNVSVSKRENIGTEKNLGLNLYADMRFTSKFVVRTNGAFFFRHTINALNKGYNLNSTNYRLNANASYEFTPTLSAECFGNFNSPRNDAQGRYPSFTNYSLGIRKQFLQKKASIAFTATNPFSNYVKQETVLFGPNFNSYSIRRVPFRSFGLNFNWRFGKLEFKKEREESSPTPEG